LGSGAVGDEAFRALVLARIIEPTTDLVVASPRPGFGVVSSEG